LRERVYDRSNVAILMRLHAKVAHVLDIVRCDGCDTWSTHR
jgi:hypothetical protein